MVQSSRKKPNSLHRLPIVDKGALRAVLQEVYEQEGTHKKAANRLGIGKHTFTKLLNGTLDGMAFDTYSRILRSLGGQAVERGRVPDPVLEFIAHHEGEPESQRLRRGAEAMVAYDLYHTFKLSVMTADRQLALAHYESWVEKQVERLEKDAHPLLDELMTHAKYRRRFRDFLAKVRGSRRLPRQEDTRCWLALYRAVEPLCAATATGGVERTWEEMDNQDEELKAYLKASLRREELLMKRERDWERILRFPADQIEYMKADLAGVFEEGVLPEHSSPSASDMEMIEEVLSRQEETEG